MPEQYQAHPNPVLWRVRRRDGEPLFSVNLTGDAEAMHVSAIDVRAQLAHEAWSKNFHRWGGLRFCDLTFEVVEE